MGSPTITIAKNATINTDTMYTFTILVTGSILLSNVGAVPGGHYRGGYFRKAAPAPTKTIAELAIATPQLSTLLAAVKAADLVETLSGEGPFTVFAPTNDAFAKIPAETLNGLLADKEALTKVLLRHVVPGTVFAKGVCSKERTTAGGEKIRTETSYYTGVKVFSDSGEAKVVAADVIATNGVIHAIDSVI